MSDTPFEISNDARAVIADTSWPACRRGEDGADDRRTDRCPAWDERRETPSLPPDDKEVDVLRAGHDWNATVGIAPVPLGQIAIVDLAVLVRAGDRVERLPEYIQRYRLTSSRVQPLDAIV
jgi:hypothetical protein